MTLSIIKPGLLTTIQDLGRSGFQKHGVIMSGAMDSRSLRLANLLVGNEESEAALEITLVGPSIKFEQDALIAIAGGDLSPSINQHPVPMYRQIYVRKNSVLSFGPVKSGCRSYLAVSGGFLVEKVLGSKSTYLRANLGGYKGRPIQTGDVLAVGEGLLKDQIRKEDGPSGFIANQWAISTRFYKRKDPTIRVIAGPHFEQFSECSQKAFFQQPFRVTPKSDRMGYRLSGASLTLKKPLELVSEAVHFGTIQVPPDGNPIVLLADRQTIGGYPKMLKLWQ
ncbi:allophanate hydrolase 2 subunit 2 [Halalkalibacter wakoensis JCM 9140]|uniref:Allophanate hydrolase 2 subunit 2 n=1 Tax=Halalkalibacter wakoensis JCM 9140 TaxID=1236970 RepID=W4Q3B0_9BACI|nr:biotin-dependent carboxyltransferase family protein [Halalkalibacter wakoensis]GAE26415.1 allophanate hydrolase 2 subunit 2 [Halalkalibacter wakoensis JCM 9140]